MKVPDSKKNPPETGAPASQELETMMMDDIQSVATGASLKTGGRISSLMTDNDGWINERYRVLEKLGEGGFGLVFRAEQIQPIHRMVAVKVLKAGADTQSVIARFDTERQSLALMEHPNIARVLDAGETEKGSPYFVMELVRGRSITAYCSQHEMSIQERIELFLPVCAAVHHAHQKGIIHRDLKPSNVMVMEEDGAPTPKVIDFGIAKVLEGPIATDVLLTGMDQLVGTPGYISPEQIEHGSSHVDTRSDVYALGSILMELLSGRALVTPMDVAHKPLHQILRDQVERDPPKPSSREPLLKGDLDWIILKALERDPARRYGSADDLADDLRRHLRHQPVVACPPSKRYLIGKFVRRHRVGVAASVAIALAVLAGGITSTALYFQSEHNRKLATQSREDLKISFSRSDEQMARQFTERTDHANAVARLCRSLRTDPGNSLAGINLLSLLAHEHLIHPTTPYLSLPEHAREARLVALSRETNRALAVSRIEKKAANGVAKEVLSIWNLATLRRTDRTLPDNVGVRCLTLSPQGQDVYVAMDNGTVEQIHLATDEVKSLALKPALPEGVICMALSNDGSMLVVGGEAGTIQAWNLRDLNAPAQVLRQENPVKALAVSFDGQVAASASAEGVVYVWDLSTGQRMGEAIEVDEGLATVAINRGREWVAIGMNNGNVHVGSYRTGREVLPTLVHPKAVLTLTISPDASMLTAGDAGGYLHTWNLETGGLRFPAHLHDGEIIQARQAVEQGLIASVSKNGELQVWNTVTGMRSQHRLQHGIAAASVTEDCSMLVMAPRYESVIQVWSIHNRMSKRRFLADPDQRLISVPPLSDAVKERVKQAVAVGWSRSGQWMGLADREGHVEVFDIQTGAPTGKVFQHAPAVGAVQISNDGKTAITSGRDREVRVWDVTTGLPKGVVFQHQSFVDVIALSPDEKRLVTITEQGEIRVWDVETGDCLTPGVLEGLGITHAMVSDDGTQIRYRMDGQGWYSLPMPPEQVQIPEWFLNLAEALARSHLDEDGKTHRLSLEDLQKARAAVPTRPGAADLIAAKWASWLLADPERRPLTPVDGEPFDDYLKSLLDQKSLYAAEEVLRFRPHQPEAEKKLREAKR